MYLNGNHKTKQKREYLDSKDAYNLGACWKLQKIHPKQLKVILKADGHHTACWIKKLHQNSCLCKNDFRTKF